MHIRACNEARDFSFIKRWIQTEREHTLWCANVMRYPVRFDDFKNALQKSESDYGGKPYVATDDSDTPVGFFVYSMDNDSKIGFLAFFIVDCALRGKGIGTEMAKRAIRHAFEMTNATAVRLNVFAENADAVNLYKSIGFIEQDRTSVRIYENEMWHRISMALFR